MSSIITHKMPIMLCSIIVAVALISFGSPKWIAAEYRLDHISVSDHLTLFVFLMSFSRKTKFATVARNYRKEVCAMLGKIDESLAKQATQHCPRGEDSKKRKSDATNDAIRRPSKKADYKFGAEMTMVEREEKAMKDLVSYIEKVGGTHFTSMKQCFLKV